MFHALSYLSNFISQELAQEGINLCFNTENKFIGIPFQSIHKIIGNLFHWQPLPSAFQICLHLEKKKKHCHG